MDIKEAISDSMIFMYLLVIICAWYGLTNWIIAAMVILIIAECLKIAAKVIRKRKGHK